jgi:anaerobic selenocysteine-containing dehydrogenase
MDRRFAAPYISYTPAVLQPDGDMLSEWEVFAGIAQRLGTRLPLPGGDLPVDGSADDDMVLDYSFAKGRMPMSEIREKRSTIHEELAVKVVAADPEASARFAVAPPDVVEELAVVLTEQTGAEVIDGFDAGKFPFRLISRRLKHVLNSLGREIPGLARVGTTNAAYMNLDDMKELDIADGDLVRITSPSGRVVGVAEGSDTIKRGVISMSHSWGGSTTDEDVRNQGTPTNRLCTVDSGYDPINGMAIQSAIPVAVVKA